MISPTRLRTLARAMLLAAVCLLTIASGARAQDPRLEINVRTNVVDKSIMWSKSRPKVPGEGGHSKVYGILKVEEVKAEQRLVRKVDEQAILELLSQEMNRNGFQLYAPGTKPDIVITASYGRGELANPYIRGVGETGGGADVATANAAANAPTAASANGGVTPQGGPSANDSGAVSLTITGAFASQLMDEKGNGFEAKLQKAATEKLYIRVVGWAYPSDPKAKSKMLWKTTMVVDDPDHRDLNQVAAAMLEAGAPFFDKEIREREADIYKPVPDGRVKFGTPEVVAPKTR